MGREVRERKAGRLVDDGGGRKRTRCDFSTATYGPFLLGRNSVHPTHVGRHERAAHFDCAG